MQRRLYCLIQRMPSKYGTRKRTENSNKLYSGDSALTTRHHTTIKVDIHQYFFEYRMKRRALKQCAVPLDANKLLTNIYKQMATTYIQFVWTDSAVVGGLPPKN